MRRPYLYGDSNLPPYTDENGETVHETCYFKDRCDLWRAATHVCIPGRGAPRAKLLIVGEAPGQTEDARNLPFIGPAGEVLNRTLKKTDIADARVTNIVRCVPRKGRGVRAPTAEEKDACSYYLLHEIAQSRPEVIVTLGASSTGYFTPISSMTKARGKLREITLTLPDGTEFETKLVPTWHPAYLLRNPNDQSLWTAFEEDLRLARRTALGEKSLEEEITTRTLGPKAFAAWVEETLRLHAEGEVPYLAFDLETGAPRSAKGLLPYHPESFIVGLCFARGPDEGVFVPLQHEEAEEVTPRFVAKGLVRKLFETIPIVGHQVKFDIGFAMAKLGVPAPKVVRDDTKLAAYFFLGKTGRHSLKDLGVEYLGTSDWSGWIDDFWRENKVPGTRQTYDKLPLESLARYGALDAVVTWRLVPILREIQRTKHPKMERTYERMVRAIRMFSRVEDAGVPVEIEKIEGIKERYRAHSAAILEQVERSEWGQKTLAAMEETSLSLTKTAHLRHLIHEEMQVPVEFRTATGQPSVGDAQLIEYIRIAEEYGWHSRSKVLRKLRAAKKVDSIVRKYLNPIPKYVYGDGVVHASYSFPGQHTGRLATTKPTIHTLPSGSDIRRLFHSRWKGEGGLLIDADYSQLELRVLACLSDDPVLRQSYAEGLDIHRFTASQIYGVPYDDPEHWKTQEGKAQRRYCKTIGFGIVYGRGAKAIAEATGLSPHEGQALIDLYFTRFAKVAEYIARQHAFVAEHGFVFSPTGQMYPLPGIFSDQREIRAKAERAAQNYPIQGSASHLTVFALIAASETYEARGYDSKVFGFIHDAAMSDVHPGELLDVWDVMKAKMETEVPGREEWDTEWITVPMVAEAKIGVRWDGGMEARRTGPATFRLRGPVEFFKEIAVEVKKGYSARFRIVEQWTDEQDPFALMARQAYGGEVSPEQCEVEMEILG